MRILIALLAFSAPAFAGIVVSGNLIQNGSPGPLKQFYQGDNARLEYRASPGSAQDNWLVYRGGTGMISVVDSAKKSFLELNERDVERLGPILSIVQRSGKSQKPLTPKDVVFKKEKGQKTVGAFKCTPYTILSRGTKSGTLCIVPLTSIGATPADFKPLGSLAHTFTSLGSLAPQQSSFLGWGVEEALKLGFMVEAVGFDTSGATVSKLVVDSVKREDIAENVFTNPAGFTKNDLTSLLQGMMKSSGK